MARPAFSASVSVGRIPIDSHHPCAGKNRKALEIDRNTIDELYNNVRDDVQLHNDFVPMKHRHYMECKLVCSLRC